MAAAVRPASKAVLFDLFETLITESATQPPRASALGPELGCEDAAFRARWRTSRRDVVVGRTSFLGALATIAAGLGGRPDEVTLRRIRDERLRAKRAAFDRVGAGVVGLLRDLRRRGLRLGVVSNCFAEDVARWAESSIAPYFDCAVFSWEVGVAKPDPRIYREATRRLEVDPAATWFVGDGADGELEGAERAGLRAIRASWFLPAAPGSKERTDAFASAASLKALVELLELAMDRPPGDGRNA